MPIHAVTPVSAAPATPAPSPTPASTEAPAAAETPSAALTPASGAAPSSEAPKTVSTDLDANEVKQWAALSRSNREAKAKIVQLEKERDEAVALKPTAEKYGAQAEHIKAGKMLAAAQAAGIDIEAAFSEWMGEEAKAVSGPPPKELVEIKEKLERLEAKDADADKARKAQDEATTKASQAKASQAFDAQLADIVAEDGKSDAPKWRRVAKEPSVNADVRAILKEAALKTPGKVWTDAEALQLTALTLDQLESHYAELGKRYAVDEVPPRSRGDRGTSRVRETVASRQVVTIDNNRGSVRKPTQEAPKFQTFKEIKAELLSKRANRTT